MDQISNILIYEKLTGPLYQTVFSFTYYKLLPVVFLLSILLAHFNFRKATALDCVKRLIITAILLIAFPEIQKLIITISNSVSDLISGGKGGSHLTSFFSVMRSKEIPKGSFWTDVSQWLLFWVAEVVQVIALASSIAMMAIRQFMMMTLTVLSPLLITCHMFKTTENITKSLFSNMIEISCWGIVWSLLELILAEIPRAQTYNGGETIVLLITEIVIALAMIGTPLITKSILGGGLASSTTMLQFGTIAALSKLYKVPQTVSGINQSGKNLVSKGKEKQHNQASTQYENKNRNHDGNIGPEPPAPEKQKNMNVKNENGRNK